MKTALRFVLAGMLAVFASACAGSTATSATTPLSALPHQMKGYELYSWQSGGSWNYVLISGTDRLKTVDEITTAPDSVPASGLVKVSAQDVSGLESHLRRLPANESISCRRRSQRPTRRHGIAPQPAQRPGSRRSRIPRDLLEGLRAVRRENVAGAVGRHLTRNEIEAMMARRDRIVAMIDTRLKSGEQDVVC